MLQRRTQLQRIKAIVIDSIARTHHLAVLQSGNSLHKLQLNVRRQRRTHALYIHFIGTASLRLDKQLMTLLIGEAHNLRFDRRAVTRADALDHAVIHTG